MRLRKRSSRAHRTHQAPLPSWRGERGKVEECSKRRDRGVALFLAIVCLAIIAAISGSLIHVVHSQRQQIRLEECKLQADWLAEAGLERARAKLVGSPDYSGETWSIAASELAGRFGATVNITVEDVADQPAQRLVRVQADFPADSHGRARHGKQAVIQITKRTGE